MLAGRGGLPPLPHSPVPRKRSGQGEGVPRAEGSRRWRGGRAARGVPAVLPGLPVTLFPPAGAVGPGCAACCGKGVATSPFFHGL